MLTGWQWSGSLSPLPHGQWMPKADQLVVELHFVPLSSAELDERRRRLRALLLRGALRFVQQDGDCNPQAAKPETAGASRFDLVQK